MESSPNVVRAECPVRCAGGQAKTNTLYRSLVQTVRWNKHVEHYSPNRYPKRKTVQRVEVAFATSELSIKSFSVLNGTEYGADLLASE